MTKPRLTYFDSPRSRGEECRLALYLAGVEFEDNRIPRNTWPAHKPTTPFGGLPTFELAGKPTVSQVNAILAHIGRRHGLLPKDDWEAMRHESLLSAAEDLRHKINTSIGIQDPEELKRRRAELAEGPIRTWAANMEKQIQGPFVGGSEISVADIKLFIVTGWLRGGVLDHIPKNVLDGFPKLEKLFESVRAHPKVVEWYARPTAPAS
jgi:glutathione S-transferase